MPSQSVFRVSVLAGGVAASATAGALVAMGRRLGRAALPFATMSEPLLRRTGASTLTTVLTGFVVHIFAIAVWTLVFVWLANRLNRSVLAAITVGAANFFGSWMIARFTGFGIATVLPLGDRLTLSAVLAGALVVGMRYARSSVRHV